MTLLCLAPSPWWDITTNEPTTGPGYMEICEGRKVAEQGVVGYVISGYGEEPYDGRWFVEIEVVEKKEEIKECLNV